MTYFNYTCKLFQILPCCVRLTLSVEANDFIRCNRCWDHRLCLSTVDWQTPQQRAVKCIVFHYCHWFSLFIWVFVRSCLLVAYDVNVNCVPCLSTTTSGWMNNCEHRKLNTKIRIQFGLGESRSVCVCNTMCRQTRLRPNNKTYKHTQTHSYMTTIVILTVSFCSLTLYYLLLLVQRCKPHLKWIGEFVCASMRCIVNPHLISAQRSNRKPLSVILLSFWRCVWSD